MVWKLDRLSSSLKDLIGVVGWLEFLDIGLISLHESVDTLSNAGKLVFHLFGAEVEFEHNLIQERTRAGIQAERARGRKGGRPKALDGDKRDLFVKLYDVNRYTIIETCEMMHISKPTLYKYAEGTRD